MQTALRAARGMKYKPGDVLRIMVEPPGTVTKTQVLECSNLEMKDEVVQANIIVKEEEEEEVELVWDR